MNKEENIISGRKLVVGYKNISGDNILLNEIDLYAKKGELIAIIGLNGSGKSSLLKSLLKLEDLLGGELEVFNSSVHKYSSAELAKKIAFVSTHWNESMNMNVNELIRLGRFPYTNMFGKLSEDDISVVNSAITKMKLENLSDRKISEISDGEKQRTMIARAIAQDTELIFLDEPTAFLDIPNKYDILSYLRNLCNEGKTIIFSTHDFQLATRFSDRFWLIGDKKIIDGSPEDLVLEGTIDKYFQSPGLLFDLDSGDFIPKYNKEQEIGLVFKENHNVQAWWTHRALRRIGYKTTKSEQESEKIIVIEEDNDKIIWKLQYENQNLLFHKILDLINHLKTQNYEFN